MNTINDLKLGARFRKWDGSVCKLIEKTSGRARIRLEKPVKKVHKALFRDKEGNAKQVKFVEKISEYDVSLGCEILEAFDKVVK